MTPLDCIQISCDLQISSQHVKNQIEGVHDQFTSIWKWRVAQEGKASNGLEEGEHGPREMSKVELAQREYPNHPPICGNVSLIFFIM